MAPHKAVMLLAVIDLIEEGALNSNMIQIDETLRAKFRENWTRYVGESSIFNCQFSNTFAHLNTAHLWHLNPISVNDLPKEFSIAKLRESYSSAELDAEFFQLLHDVNNRAHVRAVLIGKYICQLFED